MSGIPTIPGVPTGGITGSIGPQGISLSANLSMDRCNARPIFVYVVAKEGKIWRIFDPLSPSEKLPVWKEWTEEIEIPKGHWEEVTIPGTQPPSRPPVTPPTPGDQVRRYTVEKVEVEDSFKFDKPSQTPTSDADARPSFVDGFDEADFQQRVTAALNKGASNGDPLPATIKRKIFMFAHADMCAPYVYNSGLTQRRAAAVQQVMPAGSRTAILTVNGKAAIAACADFNPRSGPNRHEQAAEDSPNGVARNPDPPPAPDGNEGNRRVELWAIPDYTDPGQSKITELLRSIKGQLADRGVSDQDWPDGGFPCRFNRLDICHKLTSPSPGAADHETPGGEGAGYRQCDFYRLFINGIQNITIEERSSQPTPPPQPQPQPQPTPPTTTQKWVTDTPEKQTIGEYHPPVGEHYAYYMDNMVRHGVVCNAEFAATVAVAPNKKVDPDDFNLIKAGPIRVVKMDIGFWGDERKLDLSRKAGFRRAPARYFGMIEGQFVFLCYFQTPDNAGFVKGCSEDFDSKLTPLSAQLADAVKKAGFKILIMAKAVAEDGPDPKALNLFFPDMHLPRKFDEKDPVYATSECVFRVDSVKSMVLHQLKRDYRLPAAMTPWLATQDRELCRDFFERGKEKLKLPHWNTARQFSNPFDPQGSDVLSSAVDAVKKAYQALMQVGYYMFEFTQDDYRRMVRKYTQDFPEKGYGHTKDALFNWFYGFTTDKNIPPPQKSGIGEDLKSMIPGIVSEVADTNFGTSLGPDPGTKPATESFATVDAAPARDLLRLLKVVGDQNSKAKLNARVFQTGDLYEMWANRRYLFEDFHDPDDPAGQEPQMAAKLQSGSTDTSGKSPLAAAAQLGGEALEFLARNFLKIMLGGINGDEHDLWYRRECSKNIPTDQDDGLLPEEESWNLNSIDDDFMLPQFTAPSGGPGSVGIGTDPNHPLKTPNVNYTHMLPRKPPKTSNWGKAYLDAETQQRLAQVESFEAPLRTDATGKAEDQTLLGSANIVGKSKDQGRWNRAVVDAFGKLGTKFIYGNHDCYRGVPRQGGTALAEPFHSEPGLWVEHAHRFEDSNLDGQPFGAFITNLAFEIQELAFGEGLLDEYTMHREQSLFQPGIMQWFLLTEFGLDTLDDFKKPPQDVPPVHRFRIAVNSHTHVPDLVVGQIIFKDREVTKVELPLLGSVSAETLINGGGALLKGILLAKQLVDWYNKWNDRHGFEKWWEDIKGNTINWGVDFAGLASCVDKAIDFIKKQGENTAKKLKNEWDNSTKSLKQAANQNLKNQGLPPIK